MASKQTVTFTLTDAQAKKWTGILQSKEGVKKLTASLRELEKLKKYKEAQQIKKTNKTARRTNRMESGRYCAKCLQTLLKEAVRS